MGHDLLKKAILLLKMANVRFDLLIIVFHTVCHHPLKWTEIMFFSVTVSIVAQKDVPPFGPPLNCAIFDKGLALKHFLLSKLINGERAAYQANKFQMLHQRTRATLLVNLAKELREQTIEYINANYQSSLSSTASTKATSASASGGMTSSANSLFKDSKSPSPSSSRLLTSVKRALKHVGSTKHELNRHVSSGSLSEVVLSYEKQP